MSSSIAHKLLRDIDVFVFDAMGTTVDWFTTVTRQVACQSNGTLSQDQDAADFAREWRKGYYDYLRNVTAGGQGSLNLDVAHRQILDEMLASPRWSHLTTLWDDAARTSLVHIWHDLDLYEDTLPGLTELAKSAIVVTLSNGSYRQLVDMAKNKHIPWDGILSTEFFGVYKPSAQAYLSAAYHLGVSPERVAMVAAHKWDLEGAASAGFKTIYVPRPAEDTAEIRENMRGKADGGAVDLVVKDFTQLATLTAEARK